MNAAWEQVGDVLDGEPPDPRGAARARARGRAGTRATWRRSSRRRPGACSRSPRRCTAACSTAASPCPPRVRSSPLAGGRADGARRVARVRPAGPLARAAGLAQPAAAGQPRRAARPTARSPPPRRGTPPAAPRSSTRSPRTRGRPGVPRVARRPARARAVAARCVLLVLAVLVVVARVSLVAVSRRLIVGGRRSPRAARRRCGGCSRRWLATAIGGADALREEARRPRRSTRCPRAPTSRHRARQRLDAARRARPTAPRPTRFKHGARRRRRACSEASARPSRRAPCAAALDVAALAQRVSSRSIPTRTVPRARRGTASSCPAGSSSGIVEPLSRGDGLPGDRHADVRAARRSLVGAVPAEPQPDRAEQHHAARDQPAVHRGLHGRPQPRVRPRAAVARVPDRPARQLLPPVLGRARLPRRRAPTTRTQLRERLRDIPPLHRWPRRSALGDHDNRERRASNERGARAGHPRRAAEEVPDRRHLRAARASGAHDADGPIDPSAGARARRRSPTPRRPTPPRDKVSTPLYEAKVDPDIYFFGFDLTTPRRAGRHAASTRTTTRAGSSSSRSARASRASASTSTRDGAARASGTTSPGPTCCPAGDVVRHRRRRSDAVTSTLAGAAEDQEKATSTTERRARALEARA